MFETPSTRGINVLKKITSDLTVTGSVSNIFFLSNFVSRVDELGHQGDIERMKDYYFSLNSPCLKYIYANYSTMHKNATSTLIWEISIIC